MFENLSEKLTKALRNLSGRGKISESNVREVMDEVRRALLDADVHVDVVSDFCETVLEDAIGANVRAAPLSRLVAKSLGPGPLWRHDPATCRPCFGRRKHYFHPALG